MLGALPRERAPLDILETLQGQLERSALLGANVEESGGVLKISPWAQVRAIAAVLVLAAGLGALIYYVLPSTNPPAPEVVFNKSGGGHSVPVGSAAVGEGRHDELTLEPGTFPSVIVSDGSRDYARFVAKSGESVEQPPGMLGPIAFEVTAPASSLNHANATIDQKYQQALANQGVAQQTTTGWPPMKYGCSSRRPMPPTRSAA